MRKSQNLLPIAFFLTALLLNVCAVQSHRDAFYNVYIFRLK
jgi:hypothetical protein